MRVGKLLSIFIVVCNLVAVGAAQHKRTHRVEPDVRVRKGLPTVYITFAGFGKSGSSSEANTLKTRKLPSLEQGQYIWLQLHNNTRWEIVIPTIDLFFTFGGSATVIHPRYQVEAADGTRAPVNEVDRQEFYVLRPGRSAFFSVSREHLSNGLRIYIQFSFKWDFSASMGGPIHRVEFRSEGLPKDDRRP